MRLDQVIENALVNATGEDAFVYRLEGVKLDVEIGIHDYERGVKQRVLVDVVTLVSKAWCGTDDIATVVDYDYILNGIKALGEKQFDLQESLCGTILDIALEPAAVAAALLRSEVNNSLIIVNFFHKIQNFRQISDLFSQI